MLRILVAIVLSTTGVWAQFGGLRKPASVDTKKFDLLLAQIDTVGLLYEEGAGYINQSAELLHQLVSRRHQLPALSNTWVEVTKALLEAKTDSLMKLARAGVGLYMTEMQCRKLCCDTIWGDKVSLLALKKLLQPEDLAGLQDAAVAVDSAIVKDKEALETAKGLVTLTQTAVTDLIGQIKQNPLAAVQLKSLLDKVQGGTKRLTETVEKLPDQIETGFDLGKKVATLLAARK